MPKKKNKGLTELQKCTMIRDSYQAALDNLDHERCSIYFPLNKGYRSGYGYAMEIKSIVDKYNDLIEKEVFRD